MARAESRSRVSSADDPPQETLPSLTRPVLRRHPVDLLGRALMRVSSRRLPRNSVSWLIGPSARRDTVGHDWVDRTDHTLRLWNIPAVRLHYQMRRQAQRAGN
jgi:hypothetical protein